MFDIGSFCAKSCDGVSRRSFLKMGASVPVGLGLSEMAQIADAADRAKAKSVVLLWLWGGPSHVDMFDPKPQAPIEYRGPFATIQTRTSGCHFTELFPQLAHQSDKFALIRSNVNSNGGHPGAGTVGLTGYEENPGPVQPNFGSIIAKHRGNEGALPPFFYVGKGIPRDLPRTISGYGGGTLGKSYDPFLVHCSAQGKVSIPTLKLLNDLTPNRIDDRKQLLGKLDGATRRLDNAGIRDWTKAHQAAYGLLANPKARDAFDLSQESPETRGRYSYTTFGQSCLMARRLVEAEVPYIQVNWSEYVEAICPGADFGWDTHIYNFELLQDRHCPILDRAFSALLNDMDERGLLESTLVVCMGEFGRTPRISKRAAREHHPKCYSSIWAGAGVQSGIVIGESDKHGEVPASSPITTLQVGTTIAELAGVGPKERAEMKVLDGGSVINELF